MGVHSPAAHCPAPGIVRPGGPRATRKPFLVLSLAAAPLLPGCAPREYRAEVALLVPWSAAAQEALPDPPYVARYARDGKALSFLASLHEHRPGNQVFRMVAAEFAALEPEVVVIEGLRRAAGLSPGFYRDWVATMPEDGIWPAGEAGFTASLALARGIPFVGGEPTPQEVLEGMAGSPFGLRDLVCYFVLRQIPQWQRTGRDPEHAFPELYAAFLVEQARALDVAPADLPGPEDFATWYEAATGRPFDPAAITVMDAAPISGPQALLPNRIAVQVDLVRNASITRVTAEMLNRYDRVLVVYGAGHHVQQAPVLEAMLGVPRLLPSEAR